MALRPHLCALPVALLAILAASPSAASSEADAGEEHDWSDLLLQEYPVSNRSVPAPTRQLNMRRRRTDLANSRRRSGCHDCCSTGNCQYAMPGSGWPQPEQPGSCCEDQDQVNDNLAEPTCCGLGTSCSQPEPGQYPGCYVSGPIPPPVEATPHFILLQVLKVVAVVLLFAGILSVVLCFLCRPRVGGAHSYGYPQQPYMGMPSGPPGQY